MRRTEIWLLISFFTFALGAATVFIWFNSFNVSNEESEVVSRSLQKINAQSELPILAYCELANNPEKYDGKVVRVSGKLWFFTHGYFFLNKNCESEEKQTAVILPDGEQGMTILDKITKDTRLTEYNPWDFPEIIAVGKFRRVKPARKSDSVEDNVYLHFEIVAVEKATKQ